MLRSVPMAGKYIPTQASYVKKPTMTPQRGTAVSLLARAAANPMLTAATRSIPVAIDSVCFLALIVLPKSIDPMRLLVMKHEKIVPKGATAPSPK